MQVIGTKLYIFFSFKKADLQEEELVGLVVEDHRHRFLHKEEEKGHRKTQFFLLLLTIPEDPLPIAPHSQSIKLAFLTYSTQQNF